MGIDAEKPWICVRYKAWAGEQAIIGIRRIGYQAFLPRFIHRERRKDPSFRPLFPGFAFANCDPAREQWHDIRSVYGVLALVGQKERGVPFSVKPRIVLDLIEAAGHIDGAIDLFPLPFSAPALKAGTPLRIKEGHHLAGRLVTFKRAEPGDRLRALAEVMGIQVELLLGADQVEVVPAKK